MLKCPTLLYNVLPLTVLPQSHKRGTPIVSLEDLYSSRRRRDIIRTSATRMQGTRGFVGVVESFLPKESKEGKQEAAEADMLHFCYLEVGHEYSAAFVICATALLIIKGAESMPSGITLQVGCLSGCQGSSLGVLPLFYPYVLSHLVPQRSDSLKSLFLHVPMCIQVSPLSFSLLLPRFTSSLPIILPLLLSQPCSSFPQTVALVLRYSARPASAISHLVLQALSRLGLKVSWPALFHSHTCLLILSIPFPVVSCLYRPKSGGMLKGLIPE